MEKMTRLEMAELKLAYLERGCPGANVSRKSDEFKLHAAICDNCRDNVMSDNDLPSLEAELNELKSLLSGEGHVEPAIGQIWSLSKALEGWGSNNLYYRSPLVVLVEEIEEHNVFNVAQIHAYKALTGSRDVPLGQGMGFATAWMVYSVHRDHLGDYYDAIDKSIVEQINREDKFGVKAKVVKGSALYAFRDLEGLVQLHFAQQSKVLMEELEMSAQPIQKFCPPCIIYDPSVLEKFLETLKNDELQYGYSVPDDYLYAGTTWLVVNTSSSEIHGEAKYDFQNEHGKFTLTLEWGEDDNGSPCMYISHKTYFENDHIPLLIFFDPVDESVYSMHKLESFYAEKEMCSTGSLKFNPDSARWALKVVFIGRKP